MRSPFFSRCQTLQHAIKPVACESPLVKSLRVGIVVSYIYAHKSAIFTKVFRWENQRAHGAVMIFQRAHAFHALPTRKIVRFVRSDRVSRTLRRGGRIGHGAGPLNGTFGDADARRRRQPRRKSGARSLSVCGTAPSHGAAGRRFLVVCHVISDRVQNGRAYRYWHFT